MPKLMISVQNSTEFAWVLSQTNLWIDLKDPAHGALAPTPVSDWNHAAQQFTSFRTASNDTASNDTASNDTASNDTASNDTDSNDRSLSVAMGELFAEHHSPQQLPPGIDFAKVGLAHALLVQDWTDRWLSWSRSLPEAIQPVAVAYADAPWQHAPSPEQILDLVPQGRFGAFLIDTCDKSRGNLLAHLPMARVKKLVARAHNLGLITVLGGSLTLADLSQAIETQTDVVAVRGGITRKERNAPLCPELLADWVKSLRELKPSTNLHAQQLNSQVPKQSALATLAEESESLGR